ncbi:MAG: pyruvate kinase [Candidatus Yonathbacteria bacterium RIFOXYC1_FULL_52_10]|uniref:Pyruvate kinase n=1 Tax=Candidatus Yonathbacteria bacterium RIFOXYD1_FULL_52_36 TaxID=1802730 RepID=A0A1G2SMW0_9BACT|nr:MAG: pyruvate kinase [Candidatus Yonathbacteria bacterium RIFOXYC1_FULL_52_10]OHA86284.1 MAG: pyruvate kinase [Candidatus Yonathbacteria bacterium RIFOXYD1_FULL_52_36]
MSVIKKKTKIIATIGPTSDNERTLTNLVKAGMNVVRLNFSHGDHEGHEKVVKLVRQVAKKTKTPIAIMQDLSGPKIRIGEFYQDRIQLKKGTVFTLTTKKCVGDETMAYVNYSKLPKEVKKGNFILLDDGRKKLEVIEVRGHEIRCRVLVGGETKGRRGVNLPGVPLSLSSLTDKDRTDVLFGIKHDVDYVALSFVRRVEDVQDLRAILNKERPDVGIISKIETEEAIENIDAIIAASDGIMVARGDLAVEVPPQRVPILQKMIINKCNRAGKPVIIATQMLESMIRSSVPTRAEVSDVANSILDGADAVMLSEETALGEYPVEAVSMMTQVAEMIEQNYPHREILHEEILGKASGLSEDEKEIVDAVTYNVVSTAYAIGAKAIVALTESGFTARMVSRYRPKQPIIVMSPNAKTANQVILSFGCIPVEISPFNYVGQVMNTVRKHVLAKKIAKKGDKVVIVAGVPFGKRGGTNLLIVETI